MTNIPPNSVPSKIAAGRLGVTQPHVALLCRQGKLKGVKLGRDWFVSEAGIRDRERRQAGRPRKGHPGGVRKKAAP